jgi:hypothetical protein
MFDEVGGTLCLKLLQMQAAGQRQLQKSSLRIEGLPWCVVLVLVVCLLADD